MTNEERDFIRRQFAEMLVDIVQSFAADLPELKELGASVTFEIDFDQKDPFKVDNNNIIVSGRVHIPDTAWERILPEVRALMTREGLTLS